MCVCVCPLSTDVTSLRSNALSCCISSCHAFFSLLTRAEAFRFPFPNGVLSRPPARTTKKGGLPEEAHSAHKGQHLRPVRDAGSILHPSRDLHVSYRISVPGPSQDVPLSRQLLHYRYRRASKSVGD